MDDRILVVDDEKNVLAAIRRQLRRKFAIETAPGPEEGLAAIRENGPYAVVISDIRMPVMDGIRFLSLVRETAPDTIRMILTGNADLQNAIQAVNEGNIFRFLTKPCSPEVLSSVIRLGIRQYRLVTAERDLLQKTLKGSIKVLTEVLSLVNPEAFGRSSRIKRYVVGMGEVLRVPHIWRLEVAAMLSQVGCVMLPEEAIKKLYQGEALSGEEAQLFDMQALISADLISHIPRMGKVADIIRYQEKHFDGSGNPKDSRKGAEIPLGARILKAALDFDILEEGGTRGEAALNEMREREGRYDPRVLDALAAVLCGKERYIEKSVRVEELDAGMILEKDVRTMSGRLLITKGQEIGPVLINRLRNFSGSTGIRQPIRVRVPVGPPPGTDLQAPEPKAPQ